MYAIELPYRQVYPTDLMVSLRRACKIFFGAASVR